MVAHVVDAIDPVPVTVKMRAGWDNENNTVAMARRVVQAGVQGLAVHGRTHEQVHKGDAMWNVIADVKRRECSCHRQWRCAIGRRRSCHAPRDAVRRCLDYSRSKRSNAVSNRSAKARNACAHPLLKLVS